MHVRVRVQLLLQFVHCAWRPSIGLMRAGFVRPAAAATAEAQSLKERESVREHNETNSGLHRHAHSDSWPHGLNANSTHSCYALSCSCSHSHSLSLSGSLGVLSACRGDTRTRNETKRHDETIAATVDGDSSVRWALLTTKAIPERTVKASSKK